VTQVTVANSSSIVTISILESVMGLGGAEIFGKEIVNNARINTMKSDFT
jgi:hypothetical protein